MTHPTSIEEVREGTVELVDFLREVIADRSKNPVDDFVSYGIQAEIAGRKLTDDELVGFCFNLSIGGLDTVSANMGLQFRHLAENPLHQAELRRNPALIPAAVEELFRAYATVTTDRHCVSPIRINGVQIMPGDMVALSTLLANRDPEASANPNEVILDRNPRHLIFATGVHPCVGAPLARRELVIAMEEMLAALPDFRIQAGVTIKTDLGPIIEPQSLPRVWNS